MKRYPLKYSDIYDDKKKDASEYLKNFRFEELKRLVAHKHNNTTEWSNFIKDEKTNEAISKKVNQLKYDKIEVLNDIAYLRVIEIILSQKTNSNKTEFNINEFEENIFKAFLSINEDLEKKENVGCEHIKNMKGIDTITNKAYTLILEKFILSDTEQNRNNEETEKYFHTTIYKLQKLFSFLDKMKFDSIKQKIINQFNFENENDFISNVCHLLSFLLDCKKKGGNEFEVLEPKDILFWDSLSSEKVEIIEDFRNLKESPIFKIEENRYTYFDFLFVVDRFYKGIKFNFKSFYNEEKNLKKEDGRFFGFFGEEFSEKYLFHSICNEIFKNNKFYTLEKKSTEQNFEPDYYVRSENDIFVFECKDAMIKGDIKESRDLEQLFSKFEEKFISPKGIKQLSDHIEKIINKNFKFDDYVNEENNNSTNIYPILVLCERIYDIHGLNYIFNQYYRKQIVGKYGENYDKERIKDLTIIDIDTFIWLKDHFTVNENNFKNLLDVHLSEMNKSYNPLNSNTENEISINYIIAPISDRIKKELSN